MSDANLRKIEDAEDVSSAMSGETAADGSTTPEVTIDDDSPLYQNDAEASWNDDNGWKTLDCDINRGETEEDSSANTGSGGDGTPPPDAPGTSSCDEDHEPEHPR